MHMINILFLFQRSLAGWYTPHCAMKSNDQPAVIGPSPYYMVHTYSNIGGLVNMHIKMLPLSSEGM